MYTYDWPHSSDYRFARPERETGRATVSRHRTTAVGRSRFPFRASTSSNRYPLFPYRVSCTRVRVIRVLDTFSNHVQWPYACACFGNSTFSRVKRTKWIRKIKRLYEIDRGPKVIITRPRWLCYVIISSHGICLCNDMCISTGVLNYTLYVHVKHLIVN